MRGPDQRAEAARLARGLRAHLDPLLEGLVELAAVGRSGQAQAAVLWAEIASHMAEARTAEDTRSSHLDVPVPVGMIAEDLTGRTFGLLTVVQRAPRQSRDGSAYWLCRCECGQVCVRLSTRLRQDGVHACRRCCGQLAASGRRGVVRPGVQFGQLEVLRREGTRTKWWICRCTCGRIKVAYASNLRAGSTTRCGRDCPERKT